MKTAAHFEVPLAVCVNKWNQSPEKTSEIEAFCRENRIPFVGKIPYDATASRAVNQGRSLALEDCPASRALKDIYDRVCALLELPAEQNA